MKQKFRWFILSSLIFISVFPANGQKITVFGWIKDSSNLETIAGASISFKANAGIRSTGSPHFLSVFSDESGYFECRQIEPDSYRLQMNVVGFQSFSKEVVFTADTLSVNLGVFFLQPNAQRIREVVVEGVRKVLDFKPDRIIYNVANDPDRLTSSLTDLLQKIPMITLGPNESVQIKGRSDYKILIDGRPARGGGLSEILKSFPASSVKRIELITSPGSRYDAEGTSAGIINIVTGKRLAGYSGSINMIGSTLSRHSESYFITAKRNKIGVLGFGTIGGGGNSVKSTFVRENYYEQPLRSEIRSGEGNTRDFSYSSSLEIAYDIDSLNTISLYGSGLKYDTKNRLLKSQIGIENQGTVAERGIYDDSARYHTADIQTGCDYIRKLGQEDHEFSLLTAFRRKKLDSERFFDRIFEFGQPDAYIFQPRNKSETELILEANYVQPVSSNSIWSWGAKMIDRAFTHRYVHAEKNAEADTFLVSAGQSGIFNYRQQVGALYNQYEKEYKKWSFKAGLRYEFTNSTNRLNTETQLKKWYSSWFPSFSASFPMNERQNLRFNYTRRIARAGLNYLNPQVNAADPRNTTSGNPYLNPEFIQHMEVNWSYSYKKRNINVNADYDFYNNVINAVQLVDVLTGVAHYTFANIGRKKSTGLNLAYSDVVGKKTNFSMNTRIAYEYLSGIADGIFYTNAGLTGNVNFNVRRMLPRNWLLHTNVTVRLGDLTLQGRENTWYRYQFSVGKSLLKSKKLQLNLTVCQPFERWRTTSTQMKNAYFYILSENIAPARYFQLTSNWRFGSLSSNVSRKRGTKSNDQKNISGN